MQKTIGFVKQFGLSLASLASLALPVLASAQIAAPPGGQPPATPITNVGQIQNIACLIIGWMFWGLIVLTIIFVLIAAFKYLTAAGNPEAVKGAGTMLLYAAIAVVVALIAKGFPMIVSSFFNTQVFSGC